ncbi:MAG: type IV toxin-antitoxin system AbiEi family antitoxin domain-containing protein [Actinomycetaceae bacterium]|nr:type IV toxin-antitoxin system AbiEi family antitoxin domain-containing protein [Actinomycetaceae bacterium]
MREVVTTLDALRELAVEQYGYVTTQQAINIGANHPALSMLVKRGRLERKAHGVYRVPQIPHTPFDRYMMAILWTGAPEAVLSHGTALDLYNVSDVNPSSINVTVSKNRRIRRLGGDGYTLHYHDLHADQKDWIEGIPVTTFPTTVEQCIDTVPTYLIRQAIENGSKLGLLIGEEAETLTALLQQQGTS